ncbi:uncharacterized protein LOC106092226 [Stomoxys calcitrans]|uniref:DUF7027 domain-containing protein n=1 Tax=Stomoxys calcitrans TaxID=35570 RepID=A0A1I8PBY8_STOCA|nr:uncharacterized protein LOC106092226 [Stomoxys calcitrans]
MYRSAFAIAIGILSCMAYIVLSGIIVSVLLRLSQQEEQHYGRVWQNLVNFMMCVSVFCLGILGALSLLMIVGVRKHRCALMTPWVVMDAIKIICSFMYFITVGIHLSGPGIFSSLLYVCVSCLVWYPIYKLWRDIHSGRYPQHHELESYQPPPGYYATPPARDDTEKAITPVLQQKA